jgi:hypothetical protein
VIGFAAFGLAACGLIVGSLLGRPSPERQPAEAPAD